MLKILQARLQQYVNHELPDVQAGFRKGRGTRDHGEGGGFRMGNTCIPVADSFQYMEEPIQYCKV